MEGKYFEAEGCESVHRLCLKEHYEGSSIVDVAKIVHTCCKHGYDYIVVQYVLFIIINKYGIYIFLTCTTIN